MSTRVDGPTVIIRLVSVQRAINPNYGGGGRNHPPLSENRDCSETECPIDLKHGCKFKFVRSLETYIKKLITLGHDQPLLGTFLPRVP